jgi:hypothetical protein
VVEIIGDFPFMLSSVEAFLGFFSRILILFNWSRASVVLNHFDGSALTRASALCSPAPRCLHRISRFAFVASRCEPIIQPMELPVHGADHGLQRSKMALSLILSLIWILERRDSQANRAGLIL